MKLFVDQNLSHRLASALNALFEPDHRVEHITQKFGRGDLADEDWIERLGKEGGWCVLSGDRRIATKRPSRELFQRAGLIGFFPLPAVMKLSTPMLAARILTLWPIMEKTAATMDRGCFDIQISGTKFRPIS